MTARRPAPPAAEALEQQRRLWRRRVHERPPLQGRSWLRLGAAHREGGCALFQFQGRNPTSLPRRICSSGGRRGPEGSGAQRTPSPNDANLCPSGRRLPGARLFTALYGLPRTQRTPFSPGSSFFCCCSAGDDPPSSATAEEEARCDNCGRRSVDRTQSAPPANGPRCSGGAPNLSVALHAGRRGLLVE